MKIISLLLLIGCSLSSFAQSGELQVRVLILDKHTSVNDEMEWHEVLELKPKLKCKAPEGFYLSTFISGLEAGLDGKVSYEYNLEGTNRNPKVERHIGGAVSGTDQIRADEVVSFNIQESFDADNLGIWDFKITLTDRVTGKKVVNELKGVEVSKE